MKFTKRDPLLLLTAVVMIVIALLGIRPVVAHSAPIQAAPVAAAPVQVADIEDPRVMLPGCSGKFREQASDWNQRTLFGQHVLTPRPRTETRDVIHAVNLIYWFCPAGRRPNKVKAFGYEACHMLPEGGSNFDGAWYELFIYDSDDTRINLPKVLVPEGKKENYYQRCKFFDIPAGDRKWQFMKHHPRWNVWSKIRREGILPDEQEVNWDTMQGSVRFIEPGKDFQITDWQYP